MDDIASRFFDKEQTCPEEIIDCEKLKNEYFSKLDTLKVRGGCSPCIERGLRNQFIEKIKNTIKQ